MEESEAVTHTIMTSVNVGGLERDGRFGIRFIIYKNEDVDRQRCASQNTKTFTSDVSDSRGEG